MRSGMEEYVERFHRAMVTLKRKMTQELMNQPYFGLTWPQFYMLHFIREKGPSKITALAEKMGVKPSAITVMIDRLVQSGFAVREPDEKDRRVVLVRITEQGLEVLNRFDRLRKEAFGRYLERLEPAELEQFVNTLEKLVYFPDGQNRQDT